MALHDCCTLTSAADFLFPWQGTQPAVIQLFPRYSVDIYKCINASELVSLSRSPCGLQKSWTTSVHVHIAIATEVVSSEGAPTPAGTSVFTKHNWDMGMGYLWLNGWGIYHLMGGAFMT